MTNFRWEGRGPNGRETAGEMVAPSKDQVVERLRGQRILVTKVTADSTEPSGLEPAPAEIVEPRVPEPPSLVAIVREGATKPSHPFQGLLISGAFTLAALLVGSLAPIVVCQCERVPEGRVDCAIKERSLGVVPLRQQSLVGVTTVETEVQRSSETRGNSRVGTTESRVVLGDSLGNTVRPYAWEGSSAFGASAGDMRAAIADLIRDSAPRRISLWQGHWVPLLLAALCLLIGGLMFVATVLSLFRGSRSWVYGQVEALAEESDRRRKHEGR